MTKSPNFVGFRGSFTSKDKSGADILKVFMSPQDLTALLNQLAQHQQNPEGAHISFHTSFKTDQQTGKQTSSTYCFVNAGEAQGQRQQQPHGRFVPVGPTAPAAPVQQPPIAPVAPAVQAYVAPVAPTAPVYPINKTVK